jgi:hypothetical protein
MDGGKTVLLANAPVKQRLRPFDRFFNLCRLVLPLAHAFCSGSSWGVGGCSGPS